MGEVTLNTVVPINMVEVAVQLQCASWCGVGCSTDFSGALLIYPSCAGASEDAQIQRTETGGCSG